MEKKFYTMGDVKLQRDDILEAAALRLENDSQFPDARGEQANLLRAKRAIREALRTQGMNDYSVDRLESQISNDAYEVLDLLKK